MTKKTTDKLLEKFLTDKAKEIKPSIFEGEWADCVQYKECVNPDAINGDDWLEKRTSYIWKVGVLATWDSNKCDWVNVFIGHHRSPDHEPEFIGHLYWQDGENDDIGRCLNRYINLLEWVHPVFENP